MKVSRTQLNSLPYDIMVEILHNLDDFGSLYNLILTGRNFHSAWIENQLGICNNIIRREVFPFREALAVYFLTEHNDESIFFPKEGLSRSEETNRITLHCVQSLLRTSRHIRRVRQDFQEHSEVSPQPSNPSGAFKPQNPSPSLLHSSELSRTEVGRFNKAFYHLLYYAAHRPEPTPNPSTYAQQQRFIPLLSLPDLLIMDTLILFIYRRASYSLRDRNFFGGKFQWGMFFFVDVHSTYSRELRKRLGEEETEVFIPCSRDEVVFDVHSWVLEELKRKEDEKVKAMKERTEIQGSL